MVISKMDLFSSNPRPATRDYKYNLNVRSYGMTSKKDKKLSLVYDVYRSQLQYRAGKATVYDPAGL